MTGLFSFNMYKAALLFSSFLSVAQAQQAGTATAEVHPAMSWQQCASGGSCSTVNGAVVIDANWRWLHSTSGYTNCYTGNTWDKTLCPDDVTCAANCALDGANYVGTYGATASGNSLQLNFVTGSNVGSRLFMMQNDSTYQLFKLLGQEFTFDVDVSHLPCGLNGALYFVSMDADGGMSRFPTNKAGAKYGTGYCDSQCPRDLKFINGQANVDGWVPASNSANSGIGNHGTCCAEMDIWEANSMAAAFTPHPCDTNSQTMCSGDACGGAASSNRYGGTCDPDGCDFNSYRMGNKTFFGAGMTVDTTKPMTVVTQFITNDGTTTGTLTEIKRFYVQNGKVIPNSMSTIAGVSGNSVTESFCAAQKSVFGDTNSFDQHGGLAQMGKALGTGMVLVMSLWDDYAVDMLWLDSTYPVNSTSAGAARGACATTSGNPKDVEANSPGSYVTFSNIKVGPIGSTFSSGTSSSSTSSSTSTSTSSTTSKSTTLATTTTTTTTTTTASTTTSASGATQTHWGQCAGNGYTGPTACASPYTCQYQNDWYSQCL